MNNIAKLNESTQKALANFKGIEKEQKLSEYIREKFNELGIDGKKTKLEDMINRIYQIAMTEEDSDKAIKAIKLIFDSIGGGLNERQVNVQNNFSGPTLLQMLSNDK